MLLATPQVPPLVAESLARELAQVETIFNEELASQVPCVNEWVSHIERYRGKMLRPTLVVCAALATAPQAEPTGAQRVVAAVVEMIHMATLVHDDVLDEADLRRQGATVNRLAGNETAVMLGDYLFSHAYHLVSGLNRPDIARILCQATNAVCEGELLQLANRNNWALDETTYFDIIRRKTAALCAVSCRTGAMLSDADDAAVAALADYGEHLGIAFQIVDDLLDLTGEVRVVGKTLGRDLQKGKLTLPLIHHLRMSAQGLAKSNGRLMTLLEQLPAHELDDRLDTALAHDILTCLQGTDSIAYARRRAAQIVESARASLAVLPPSPTREFLGQAAGAVLTRQA